MRLDAASLLVIVLLLAVAAYLSWVPGWVPLVAAILAAVFYWQRARESASQREAAERAQMDAEAPELAGMDFVKAAAFMLEAVDKFKARYGPPGSAILERRLKKLFAEQAAQRSAPQYWGPHVVLRRVELDILNFVEVYFDRFPEDKKNDPAKCAEHAAGFVNQADLAADDGDEIARFDAEYGQGASLVLERRINKVATEYEAKGRTPPFWVPHAALRQVATELRQLVEEHGDTFRARMGSDWTDVLKFAGTVLNESELAETMPA